MTKAAYFSIGLAAMLVTPATLSAQDNVAIDTAVKQSVLNQANTIVLRNKLADAKATQQRGDINLAARIYQECVSLCQQIGSGIDAETAQAKFGLATTRMILARDAQSRGDFRGADIQVQQVLKADPANQTAIAFQRQNQQVLESMKGLTPDAATLEQEPQIKAQKVEAGTLVQNGKLLYEAGKLEESQVQLKEALKLDPDNTAAYYFLNLIQQAKIQREYTQHNLDTQTRMADVEKRWVLPTAKANLPVPNAYATNTLVFTGAGRQVIMAKLDKIHLDNVSFDGLPLSEVLRNLTEQSRLRDPDRKGINFLINPNADLSGPEVAAPAGGGLGLGGVGGGAAGGFGGQPGMNERPAVAGGAVDPATGLPIAAPTGGTGGGESLDVSTVTVKIPSLTDVRLVEVLEAICLVADHPIKYSILDFGVVFSARGPESPMLITRQFKVDPNTFYSGLESVGALSFGASSSSSGGGGGSSGGGGGGGNSGNNQNNGAVVGIVNPFAGSGSMRNTGNGQGGGGGGGGGQGQGAANPLNGGGNQGGNMNSGGLNFITQISLASQVSAAARAYFTALGVNLLNPVGKAVFFNDKSGILLVRATEQDLDMIERAIQALNQVAPQVHIKARFIEVEQDDNKALGFDWYLGQFNMGGSDVVGTGGSSPSLTVPTSAANPLGAFPGNTTASLVPGSANDQLVTSGLRNSSMPTLGTITGIMTDPNFRVALKALEQRSGVENLGEPEVTTTSGRQTQMRATSVVTVVTSLNFQQGTSNTGTGNGNGTTTQ